MLLLVLSDDTSADAEAVLWRRWRDMTAAEKAQLVGGLCAAVNELAAAGIRARHPAASPREQFLRMAILRLGLPLARKAYPEIAQLSDLQ
jgi:hypothetical protein